MSPSYHSPPLTACGRRKTTSRAHKVSRSISEVPRKPRPRAIHIRDVPTRAQLSRRRNPLFNPQNCLSKSVSTSHSLNTLSDGTVKLCAFDSSISLSWSLSSYPTLSNQSLRTLVRDLYADFPEMLPLDGVSWVETPGHPDGELENPLAAFPDPLASSGELQSISSILEELELVAANAKALPIPRPPSLSLAEFHYALDPLELMDSSADISHRILNHPLGPTPGSIEHLQYNDTENWADSHDRRLSGQITAHPGDFDNFLPKAQDDYWPVRPPLNRRIADCRAPSPASNIQESLFPNVARNAEPTRSKLRPLRNILALKRTKRPADTNDLFDPTVNPYRIQTSRSLSEDGPASRSFLVF